MSGTLIGSQPASRGIVRARAFAILAISLYNAARERAELSKEHAWQSRLILQETWRT
jgi:hypothetical protein